MTSSSPTGERVVDRRRIIREDTTPVGLPSIPLGQNCYNFPSLNIFARNENGNWCNKAQTEKSSKQSRKLKNWDIAYGRDFNMLLNNFPEMRDCTNVFEHSDTAIFHNNGADGNVDYEIGFSVNNSSSSFNKYALLSVFSNQEERIVFMGFLTSPGEIAQLIRYDESDSAFVLTKSNIKADRNRSKIAKVVNKEMGNSVCSFKLLLTTVQKTMVYALGGRIADIDGWTVDSCSFEEEDDDDNMIENDLATVTEGREHDCVDGNKRLYHSNLVKGFETNQSFTNVDVQYKGDPIHIFNVNVLLSN